MAMTNQIDGLGVTVNYGCDGASVAEGNQVESAKAFEHINNYSCLELMFEQRASI